MIYLYNYNSEFHL